MFTYLDNSATTRPYDQVTELVAKTMSEDFGNPSSLHRLGMAAEKMVKEARANVAASLGASPEEIFFTSGGTEGDNTAIFGAVNATAILIGNRIGAGDREGAILTSRRMLFATECLSVFTALMLFAFRYPILSLFANLSERTLQDAATIILLAACVMPFRHFNTINIVGVLRAGGDTVFSMALDAGSVWVIGVPCVALATVAFGLPITGIYAAAFIEEGFKICVGLPRFLSGKWINNLTTIGNRGE